MTNDTAWAYLAVSSAKQRDTLPDQESWAKAAAKANGWALTKTFKDVSSGKEGTRQLFGDLISELEDTPKAKRPARVLMIRLDRTGRGLGLDAMGALAKVHSLGVTVHTREDGDVALTRAADTIRPILRVLTGALENEARSDKSKATYERRRALGKFVGSRPPYGTRLNDGDITIYRPEAAIVKKVFELRASGLGYRSIAREMHTVAPPRKKVNGDEVALAWNPASVRAWINCRTYRGTVVSEELFERANAVSNRGFVIKEQTKYPWPLGGSIRCECGRLLVTNTATSNFARRKKRYHYRYYLCPASHLHKTGDAPRFRAEKLEEQIPAILTKLKTTPAKEKAYAQRRDQERRDIESRIQATEKRIETLKASKRHAWDVAAGGKLSNDDLQDRLGQIDHDLEEAHASLRRDQTTRDALLNSDRHEVRLLDLARDLSNQWSRVPAEKKRVVARALARTVGGLIVSKDGTLRPFLGIEQDRLEI
jgi:site-specific DNA recombinase